MGSEASENTSPPVWKQVILPVSSCPTTVMNMVKNHDKVPDPVVKLPDNAQPSDKLDTLD